MILNQEEKQVLTLLDSARVDGVEELVLKFIKLPKDKIQKIIKKFKELDLIEVIYLPNYKQLYYFHGGKIEPDMLDDDLRYIKDFGHDSPILVSSRKPKTKPRSG